MPSLTCSSCRFSYYGTPGTPCPRCGRPAAAGHLPAASAAPAPRKAKAKGPNAPRRPLIITAALVGAAALAVGVYFLTAAIYARVTYEECLTLWNSGAPIESNRRAPDPVYRVSQPEAPRDTLHSIRYDEDEVADSLADSPSASQHSREYVDSLFM